MSVFGAAPCELVGLLEDCKRKMRSLCWDKPEWKLDEALLHVVTGSFQLICKGVNLIHLHLPWKKELSKKADQAEYDPVRSFCFSRGLGVWPTATSSYIRKLWKGLPVQVCPCDLLFSHLLWSLHADQASSLYFLRFSRTFEDVEGSEGTRKALLTWHGSSLDLICCLENDKKVKTECKKDRLHEYFTYFSWGSSWQGFAKHCSSKL